MRKQGYGSLLYTMVESFVKDVYQCDTIGIALTKDTQTVSDRCDFYLTDCAVTLHWALIIKPQIGPHYYHYH